MSAFTDARSTPGVKGAAGTDDRELYLIEFGGLVITAYDEKMDYQDLHHVKQIEQGKANTFPIVGRKRDAEEHIPGERILGGKIEHNEVVIDLDKMLFDSVFVAEVDEKMIHYDLTQAYASQLGQSLASTQCRRIAIMHILASRDVADVPQGQPTPAYAYAADMKTNGASLEAVYFAAQEYFRVNDMSGDTPKVLLPHKQHLLLSRFTGIEGGPVTTGSGNRASGTIGDIAGLATQGTNHIPNTNITGGPAKYRGNFSTTVGHVSNKWAVGTLESRGMKVQTIPQPDRLGMLMIASMFNGHGILRPENSIEIRTDAIGGRTALAL